MTATQTIWAFTLALTFSAGWIDWRTRRIPNWLTVPCLVFGIGSIPCRPGGKAR